MRLGLPDDATAAPQETKRKAYDLLVDGFGPGFNGPLMLVVDARRARAASATDAVAAEVGRLDDVADVSPPVAQRRRATPRSSRVTPRSGPSDRGDEGPRQDDPRRRSSSERASCVTGQTAVNIDFSEKLTDALMPYLGSSSASRSCC